MISIIVAIAQNGAIGLDGKIPWHLTEDLKRFKKITSGKTLIMGRKTFESLPRLLPGRRHVVITRGAYDIGGMDIVVESDLNEIISRYRDTEEEIFCIGGGVIYEMLLPECKKLYLTKIKKDFNADSFFPQIDYSKFDLVEKSEEMTDATNGLIYWYETYISKDFALKDNES